MTDTKFTPAPWGVCGAGLEFEVLGDTGNPDGAVRICGGLSKADADLVVAAPELLTALELALSIIDDTESDLGQTIGLDSSKRLIRAAIKKADGCRTDE